MTLHENGGHVGVESDGEEHGRQFDGLIAEDMGRLGDGERMQVDDAVVHVALVLTADPIDERTQIVAQMDGAGRLDAGEDAWHEENATSWAPCGH